MPRYRPNFVILLLLIIVVNTGLCKAASELNLLVGESRVLTAKSATRVAISAPELADVTVVTPSEVLVNGKKAGNATLYVWDNAGRETYNIVISQDTESMAKIISEAIDKPDIKVRVINHSVVLEGRVDSAEEQSACEKIAKAFGLEVINLISFSPHTIEIQSVEKDIASTKTKTASLQSALELPGLIVTEIGNGVVLQGWVDNQYEQQKAEKIAGLLYDKVVSMIDIKNPTQIEVEVRVVELNKNLGSNSGIEWGGFAGGLFEPGVFTLKDYSQNGVIVGVATPGFGVKIETLGKDGNLKTLANPKITTLAGQKASVLVGGEFPVGLIQPDGKVVIEWKSYGVKLDIEPDINVSGNVALKVQPEVSALDWNNAVTYGNTVLPLIKVRRINTDVSIDDGGTLVLGGLIQNEDSKKISKIPLLGDIPILGHLFKSTEFQKGETELVIFITPRVLKKTNIQAAGAPVSTVDSVSVNSGASVDSN